MKEKKKLNSQEYQKRGRLSTKGGKKDDEDLEKIKSGKKE